MTAQQTTRKKIPVEIKDAQGIAAMRVAGRLAAQLLDYLIPLVRTGITTEELDRLAHIYMTQTQGVIPAPLHYTGGDTKVPFPKSICTSVNHQVCHGIPNARVLKNGDSLNIDITIIKDGWHGDSSRMAFAGKPTPQALRLADLTHRALWRGIRAVRPGAHLGDIGHAIETFAEEHGLSVVRDYCGHGIGRHFHEEPQVTHFGNAHEGIELRAGMIFTIEPMLNAGRAETRMLGDGWTVVTKDHSLSAQWEHTILVTPDGHEVLTLSDACPPPA